MPAPDLQASWIGTALDGFPLRDASGWLDVALIVALGFVGPLVAWRFGALAGLGAVAVATVLFVVGAQLAFNSGTVITVGPVLVAAAGGGLAVLAAGARKPSARLNRLLDRLSPGTGNRRTRRLRTT